MHNVITVSCLGSMGRWGNCLFQYASARKYAEIHKCQLQTPEWLGEKVFNINHPRISHKFPKCDLDILPCKKVDIDLYGYFQFQDIISKLNRKELKSWFTFKDEWKERFPKKKEFYAACHIRKGDYVSNFSHIYCNISEKSYENKCSELNINPSDIIYVREDKPEEYEDINALGLNFLPDFMTLVNADIILRANSSFSWWAATLSNAKIYSPKVDNKVGFNDVSFVEGNWPKMVNHKFISVTDLHLPEDM